MRQAKSVRCLGFEKTTGLFCEQLSFARQPRTRQKKCWLKWRGHSLGKMRPAYLNLVLEVGEIAIITQLQIARHGKLLPAHLGRDAILSFALAA